MLLANAGIDFEAVPADIDERGVQTDSGLSEHSAIRPNVRMWHIAAPDVCDGTSAVGESRHRIPRRIRWSTD
jgi:hypothetical protein